MTNGPHPEIDLVADRFELQQDISLIRDEFTREELQNTDPKEQKNIRDRRKTAVKTAKAAARDAMMLNRIAYYEILKQHPKDRFFAKVGAGVTTAWHWCLDGGLRGHILRNRLINKMSKPETVKTEPVVTEPVTEVEETVTEETPAA